MLPPFQFTASNSQTSTTAALQDWATTGLMAAIKSNNLPETRRFLSLGADPFNPFLITIAKNDSPISLAIERADVEIFQALWTSGMDLHHDATTDGFLGDNTLDYEARTAEKKLRFTNNHPFLLKHSRRKRFSKSLPALDCIRNNRPDILNFLVSVGASAIPRNEHGFQDAFLYSESSHFFLRDYIVSHVLLNIGQVDAYPAFSSLLQLAGNMPAAHEHQNQPPPTFLLASPRPLRDLDVFKALFDRYYNHEEKINTEVFDDVVRGVEAPICSLNLAFMQSIVDAQRRISGEPLVVTAAINRSGIPDVFMALNTLTPEWLTSKSLASLCGSILFSDMQDSWTPNITPGTTPILNDRQALVLGTFDAFLTGMPASKIQVLFFDDNPAPCLMSSLELLNHTKGTFGSLSFLDSHLQRRILTAHTDESLPQTSPRPIVKPPIL
jgi:hypothetical protein